MSYIASWRFRSPIFSNSIAIVNCIFSIVEECDIRCPIVEIGRTTWNDAESQRDLYSWSEER